MAARKRSTRTRKNTTAENTTEAQPVKRTRRPRGTAEPMPLTTRQRFVKTAHAYESMLALAMRLEEEGVEVPSVLTDTLGALRVEFVFVSRQYAHELSSRKRKPRGESNGGE